MWIADNWKDYQVLGTSGGEKLESWGPYRLIRPDPQVIWTTEKTDPRWRKYDACYSRSSTGGGSFLAPLPMAEMYALSNSCGVCVRV